MPISLIKKNQLDPNIADLVGQYGSGFFLPISVSGNLTGFIDNAIQGLNFLSGINNLNDYVNITGISGINIQTVSETNSLIISYTGIPVPPNLVYTTGDQQISGNTDFVGNLTLSGNTVLTGSLSNQSLNTYDNVNFQTVTSSGIVTASSFVESGIDILNYITELSGTVSNVYATYAQLTGLSGYEASVTNLLATYDQLTGYSGFQATVDAAFATYSQLTGLSGYVNNNFYPNSNPSGYITGVDLSAYTLNSNTGNFVTQPTIGNYYVSLIPNYDTITVTSTDAADNPLVMTLYKSSQIVGYFNQTFNTGNYITQSVLQDASNNVISTWNITYDVSGKFLSVTQS